CCEPRLHSRVVLRKADQHADAPQSVEPLRMRRDRPSSRRAGQTGDEIASPHRRCPYRMQYTSTSWDNYGAARVPAKGLMSALGQKQTSQHLQPMSALPPKADIGTQSRNVRFVPQADSCTAAKSSYFDPSSQGLSLPLSIQSSKRE